MGDVKNGAAGVRCPECFIDSARRLPDHITRPTKCASP